MKHIFNTLIFLTWAYSAGSQCLQFSQLPSNITVCDLTNNDPQLWNENALWDPIVQSHDLAEGAPDLSATVADTCPGTLITARYLLFLDLNGDGVQETVIKSWDPPLPGTVNFNNAGNPNYDGGETRIFDQRPLTTDQKYQFAIETIANGNQLTARLRWNTTAAPDNFVDVQLPYGAQKVKWLFEDNLGNDEAYEYGFVIRDCKKPTVVCLNNLSVNIMPTGFITLWATDFLQYAEDNATPGISLRYGIRKAGAGTGFPVDNTGNPLLSVNFDCDELGQQGVEVWAIDLAGNADYCETFALVEDNIGNCSSLNGDIQVCIRRWCDNSLVTGVSVGGYPTTMDTSGCMVLDLTGVPLPANINITASKDDNHNNGVTPLDLVKMSKHILGLEPLPAYGMIAADINRSNTITTFDVVESRKLIMGVYSVFPNNYSWRFVDANYAFPNPSNPFQTIIPETIYLTNLGDTSIVVSYAAIKIGDVDCDATPGVAAPADDRETARLQLPDVQLAAGDVAGIPVSFGYNGAWKALATGFEFDPQLLEIQSVTSEILPDFGESSSYSPAPGTLNVLWFNAYAADVRSGEALFTLHVRALAPLRLSEVLRLAQPDADHPRRMRSEAYDGTEFPFDLEAKFRDPKQVPVDGSVGAIFQPQPNPTSGAARIVVNLDNPVNGRLILTDIAGRVVLEKVADFHAGQNVLEIPAEAMARPGVYAWRVQAGEVVNEGKLIKM